MNAESDNSVLVKLGKNALVKGIGRKATDEELINCFSKDINTELWILRKTF
jgi:hypothetical protein